MAVTFSWFFPFLEVARDEGEFQNVVKIVHFHFSAADGALSAGINGTVALPDPGMPFADFESLTPEIVQGWTKAAIGSAELADMRNRLVNQVSEMHQPATAQLLPSWIVQN